MSIITNVNDREALLAENAMLRDIVEGRATAPTDDEIDAHSDAGGSWRIVSAMGVFVGTQPSAIVYARDNMTGARWWALNAANYPCAWPSVRVREEPTR